MFVALGAPPGLLCAVLCRVVSGRVVFEAWSGRDGATAGRHSARTGLTAGSVPRGGARAGQGGAGTGSSSRSRNPHLVTLRDPNLPM